MGGQRVNRKPLTNNYVIFYTFVPPKGANTHPAHPTSTPLNVKGMFACRHSSIIIFQHFIFKVVCRWGPVKQAIFLLLHSDAYSSMYFSFRNIMKLRFSKDICHTIKITRFIIFLQMGPIEQVIFLLHSDAHSMYFSLRVFLKIETINSIKIFQLNSLGS